MEPQIVDYYNEFPSMLIVIDKLNEEYDQLYTENINLKKQIKYLKDKYEPDSCLEKLIISSIKSKTHHDIARVIHKLHENKFKCTSLKRKKWFYLNDNNEWIECDNAVQIRIVISESINIYKQYLIKLKELVEGLEPGTEEFWMTEELKIPNCEYIIDKYSYPMFSSYILKECMELFYVDGL